MTPEFHANCGTEDCKEIVTLMIFYSTIKR